MKVLTSALCAAFLLAFLSPPSSAEPAQSAERNLLAAMKLWGDVKLFDPDVSGGSVDWDGALMAAEPSLLAATTPQAYRSAVASMLAPLHDPATHVEETAPAGTAHISAATMGNATIITIPQGTAGEAGIESDTARAIVAASKTDTVAFDLRGANEGTGGDGDALRYVFSSDSPIVELISGSITLPREGSRAYLGYPNESGAGYQGYFPREVTADGLTVRGRSKIARRFAFIVDSATSLPSMAIALAVAGTGAIYTTDGSPAILAPSSAEIELPYGVTVTYRTGELPDFPARLPLQSVRDPREALTKAQSAQPLSASYARSDLPLFRNNPYADESFPAEPMRMLAVARIYNFIRYFSPYTGLMHDDWDLAATQAIADERIASDSRSYLLGLMRFSAHLHDSHGFVGGSIARAEFGAGVPFSARYLHRQVVVSAVLTGAPGTADLKVGDVIDTVDGIPVRRAMTASERYVSSSTPQAADFAALSSSLRPSIFSGKAGTRVAVTFHDLGGKRKAVTFVRAPYTMPPDRTGPKYFVLAGNVGYVDFDRIEPQEVDAMFDALKNTRAIVFDNRGYPRGAAWAIAPRLTNETGVRAALFNTPLVANPIDARRSDIESLPNAQDFYQFLPAVSGARYLEPTVMLIDERAISQSEHSALFMRSANRTRFVGTPTRGANGDVTSMILPGAVSLNFSGEGVRHANGEQLQRIGILPDVRAEPAAADIAAGNDVVLQAGLNEALRLAGVPARSRDAAVRREIARERSAFASHPAPVATVTGVDAQPLSLAWASQSAAYVGTTTAGAGYRGSDEISLAGTGSRDANATFGSFTGSLDVAAYRGKTIRIRGYLSAQNVTGGAGFWLRIDGPSRQFDNMQDRWLTGTTGWKPFAIVLHVPPDATAAYTGLLLVGAGTAHASALIVDVVPDTTQTTGQ